MSQQEYIRQLPGFNQNQSRSGFWQAVHLDPPLLSALLLLFSFGLFILYSASNQDAGLVNRQIMNFGVGFVGLLILARVPPRIYKFWAPWIYALGVLLLIAVLIMGTGAKGAQRWLAFPGIGRFQPSEIMKLVMPIMIAWYLSERVLPPNTKTNLFVAVLIIVPTLLIAKQPDLGTSLLIASSGLFVLLLAGLSWKLIITATAISIPAAFAAFHFVLHEYQKKRVMVLLNPESDPLGAGWNISQSKTAIGSGGFSGKGWLNGTQSQLDFLPESSTDFILAVLAEEFGFIGIIGLLVIYLVIIARGLQIAMNAQDSFTRLLAGSITLTFFVYIFVNIGMVSGILPVVGVPLPLVSYGGTSLVTLLAGFGILMSINSHKKLVAG